MKTSGYHFFPRLTALALGCLALAAQPRLAPAQGVVTVLHSFDGTDGYYPNKGLALASDGNFYGVTPQTSSYLGSVFKITPGGVFTTLFTFSGTDGSDPEGALVQGSDGLLYGTTESGGPLSDDAGTVFKIDTNGGGFQTLHAFSRDDTTDSSEGSYLTGRLPEAGLTQAPDGNFYGTTSDEGPRSPGNASGAGTVFKIASTGAFQTVYTFYSSTLGDLPRARLALDADGSFYSTTRNGGPAGEIGTVFKVTPDGVLTDLHNFVNTDGNDCEGGVVLAPDGKYYGLTEAGGSKDSGTYYRVSRTGDFELLGSFTDTDGGQPFDEMIVATDGNLYGTTNSGGDGGVGTIFQLTTAGVLTTVYTFPNNGSNGNHLRGTLVQGPDGRLYGTATGGGTTGFGVVFAFSLNPVITSATSASGTVGQPFSYQITATNTPTSFGATGLPDGLTLDATGQVSGTPTASGTSTITLSATNAMGTGTATLTLVVTSTSTPPPTPAPVPVITSPASGSAQDGVPFSYQIVASNSPTSFGAAGLPTGLILDPTTGIISGTPTQAGTFTVSLSATNASGTVMSTLTLTIAAAVIQVPTVTVAVAGDGMAVEGGEKGKVIFRRTGVMSAALTVRYKVKGSAQAGVDYKPLTGTVTIPVGTAQAKIKIKPLDDTFDGVRVAKVKLLPSVDGSYALGSPAVAKVKIIDNE